MATEKRLIDANALSESIKNGSGTSLQKFFADVCVATAPTVDAVEVVHGRWENHDWEGVKVKGFMACSVCNVMIPTADDNYYCLLKLNYCPNCGAKMMDGDGNG